MSTVPRPELPAATSFIPLCAPEIGGNEWRYVKECLDTGWVSSVGAFVDRFERELAQVVGTRYAVAMQSGKKVYVSNWAGRRPRPGDVADENHNIVIDPRTGIPSTGTISVIDAEKNAVVKDIDVGLHPSAMALTPKGDRLFVANANSDTVSVIDTESDTVVHSISVRPETKAPIGSSPNALAVSPDGKTLVTAFSPGLVALDISDPANPKEISRLDFSPPFINAGSQSLHSALPLWDRNLVFVASEASNAHASG